MEVIINNVSNPSICPQTELLKIKTGLNTTKTKAALAQIIDCLLIILYINRLKIRSAIIDGSLSNIKNELSDKLNEFFRNPKNQRIYKYPGV